MQWTTARRIPFSKSYRMAFWGMKKIVEDSKRAGWNYCLPIGYRLVQKVETRFRTHFLVVQRFQKSPDNIYSINSYSSRKTFMQLFQSIAKQTTPDGRVVGYPTLEEIFDALAHFYVAIIRFQEAKHPAIHKVFPTTIDCQKQVENIIAGGKVMKKKKAWKFFRQVIRATWPRFCYRWFKISKFTICG